MSKSNKSNKIERLKESLPPYKFRERIAKLNYHNLSETDRFYLKNFGIYNIKLRPETFMIRVRFDGLNISISELETVLDVTKHFKLSTILTARGGLELHQIKPENVYTIYKTLQSKGIKTHQTLTDNFRTIATDPFSDFAIGSHFNISSIITSIREFFLDNREFMGLLPRKFNSAIISTETPTANFWGNDALFALSKKGNKVGFNLYLGGKNSEVAKSADIFIEPEETKKLFIAIAEMFKEKGFRGSRAKIRLFHLIEKVGIKKVRDWIEQYFGRKLENEGVLLLKEPKEINNIIKLKDGFWGYKIVSNYGELNLKTLENIVYLVKYRDVKVRFGVDQNIYLISDNPQLEIENRGRDNLNIISCVGSRYCPLSLWDIKKDIEFLPTKRLKKLKIKVGFSGCLKGCGKHYHTDIGLIGLRTNLYAPTERAFRLFLGAIYDKNPYPARMLYYSVPKRVTNSLIETILDDFEESNCDSFMKFSRDVLLKYSTEFLQLWFVVREFFRLPKDLKEGFFNSNERDMVLKLGYFMGVDLKDKKDLSFKTREISHKLWDLKESRS